MKSIKVLVSSIFVTALLVSASYAADMKIGYMDLSRVFDEYYKTKDYDKVLEAKSKNFEKDRNDKRTVDWQFIKII